MPLKKLFQKRNSLKEMSAIQLANEEIDKLRSTLESTSNTEQLEAQSEKNLHSSDLVENIDNRDSKERTSMISTEEDEFSSKYDYLQKEEYEDYCSSEGTNQNQTRRKSAPIEIPKVSDIRKIRSTSYKEHRSKAELPISGRRKCVSESKDYTTEEVPEKTIIQLKSKDFEAAIERYVNRLISESIATAVKSVNVESICGEILESFSNRSHSSGSELIEEYDHKWSDSLAEYVELEEENSFTNTEKQEQVDSIEDEKMLKDISVCSIQASTSDGYQADSEESISLYSIDSETKLTDNTVQNVTEEIKKPNESITVAKVSSDSSAELNEPHTSKIISEILETKTDDNTESDNSQCLQAKSEVCQDELRISNDKFSEEKNESIHECIPSKNSNDVESKLSNERDSVITRTQDALDTFTDDTKSTEEIHETSDNALISFQNEFQVLTEDKISDQVPSDEVDEVLDLVENLPQKQKLYDEEKKVNWKMGYLHVKLPHKARGKGHLKAWKKRCVSIQPDEFANDPKCPSLMISVYSSESGTARKHSASFWKSISCQKAVVYRSSSRTHKYAFTISDNNQIVIHLAADCETSSQEWMSSIRAILWPPSPVMQLEKMLNGKEFEISIIDNDFAYRAGLLGMYGYLTVTRKKLILVHPQQGYVIQEWYLNTVDKFELMPQTKVEDSHKVLAMTTCSDSSTGKGELLIYCSEAITMLQSIASTIHQILTDHSVQEGGKYEKELAEMADWLAPAALQSNADQNSEEYYKVPPRQVKSLLDIPNFIFDRKLSPVASVSCNPGEDMESTKSLDTSKTNPTRASQDSGISAGNTSEDFLNCSTTSFMVGGGAFPGKSSDSELSDSYTPPRTPDIELKKRGVDRLDNIAMPSS